jgi:hypothetical protein
MKSIKFWDKDGFEVSTYKWNIAERKNKTFKGSGLDNTGKCTYTYNELGFRGDSPSKNGFKVMSIGCSITEGVGVNDNETWPAQFCSHIENGVNLNFGAGGRSNDFICRCLMSYYDLIKPDLVLIMYTSPQRREIYTKDGAIEPFIPTAWWGYMVETEDGKKIQKYLTELQNDNEDFINWYKNHQLIKLFLESKGCNWLWNGFFGIPKEYEEFNRFDSEYVNYIDYGVDNHHPGPTHNYQYSMELFEHIKTNFRNYLPEDLNEVKKNIM